MTETNENENMKKNKTKKEEGEGKGRRGRSMTQPKVGRRTKWKKKSKQVSKHDKYETRR